ncbi:MAG: histidine kinase [Alphaproteobacteria bacterium]|nr:histidine kinase [Alphaproteobacteria bacterium]
MDLTDDSRRSEARHTTSMWRAGLILVGVFWVGYLMHATAWTAMDSGQIEWELLQRRLVSVTIGVICSTAAHFIVTRVDGTFPRRVSTTFACTVVSWLVFCASNTTIFYVLSSVKPDVAPSDAFLTYLLQFSWIFAAWMGAYVALMAVIDLQAERERAVMAQAQAQAAQLAMLRYQLNPHFLFNTLNSISSLVLDKRNAEAEQMLLRLSGFLRHTIDSDSIHKSTLGREANMQREYLGIEAARFGDKLRCHCDLPEALHDCMVPSMLLQPLVENAIKYAVAPANKTAHIWLGGSAENGRLILYVEDDGPGIDPNRTRKEGVGWSNTRDRLATLYGAAAEMRITRGSRGGGVLVELDMPLERG